MTPGAQLTSKSPESDLRAPDMPSDAFLDQFGWGEHIFLIQKFPRQLPHPPGPQKCSVGGLAAHRSLAMRRALVRARHPSRCLMLPRIIGPYHQLRLSQPRCRLGPHGAHAGGAAVHGGWRATSRSVDIRTEFDQKSDELGTLKAHKVGGKDASVSCATQTPLICVQSASERGERGQDGRPPRPTSYLDGNTQLPRAGCCGGARLPTDYCPDV